MTADDVRRIVGKIDRNAFVPAIDAVIIRAGLWVAKCGKDDGFPHKPKTVQWPRAAA